MRALAAGLLSFVALLCLAAPVVAAPAVLASIKPIHSLVAGVMEGVGEPALLVSGGASPHTYSLKPSDARALEQADIVFWVGPGLETFLETALSSLAGDATTVALAETPGLRLLPVREGGAFESHEHEQPEAHQAHHGHDGADMHIWLDPGNAETLVDSIATTLATADPENAERYRDNANSLVARIRLQTEEIRQLLGPVRDRPAIVFHDAYQYFEQAFGLTVVGSLTVTPDAVPGAQRIAELREKLRSLGPACVFAEPQFTPAILSTLVEGTGAQTGILDPEGASLEPGPELWFELMRSLAQSSRACLE